MPRGWGVNQDDGATIHGLASEDWLSNDQTGVQYSDERQVEAMTESSARRLV
jgi:hypothetical protein